VKLKKAKANYKLFQVSGNKRLAFSCSTLTNVQVIPR
jgi:hypothetical protein